MRQHHQIGGDPDGENSAAHQSGLENPAAAPSRPRGTRWRCLVFQALLCLLAEAILQRLARLENRGARGGNREYLAGSGVASLAGSASPALEGAEARDRDLASLAEFLGDEAGSGIRVEDSLHRRARVLPRQACLLRQKIDQLRLV